MAALLLENVPLRRDGEITIHVRFRGGATTTLRQPLPRQIWQVRTTSPQALDRIAQLLEQERTHAQIATTLNAEGFTTGAGQPFTGARVHWLGHAHGLKHLRQRLRDAHWLTAKEIAAELGIGRDTLRRWRNNGHLLARLCNDKGEWLYRPASEQLSLPPRSSTPAWAGVAGPSATSL
jgi:hypothetical protein